MLKFSKIFHVLTEMGSQQIKTLLVSVLNFKQKLQMVYRTEPK